VPALRLPGGKVPRLTKLGEAPWSRLAGCRDSSKLVKYLTTKENTQYFRSVRLPSCSHAAWSILQHGPSSVASPPPSRPSARFDRPAVALPSSAMTGMYMSGLLMSSRGGRNMGPDCPLVAMGCCWRDQGRWRQGKRTMKSLLTTYLFETLK